MRLKTFFHHSNIPNTPMVWLVSAFLIALCSSAVAQQLKRVPRIGYLANSPLVYPGRIEAFRQGLRDLGYTEGRNIVIEWRYNQGNPDRIPALAAELVRLKVDVIVTTGALRTRAAKAATKTIPIIMAQEIDPIGSGFVASLARPGGNVTGLSSLSVEISGKRLELVKEIIPRVSRVAIFGSSTVPGTAQQLREMESAAKSLGVKLNFIDITSPKEIDSVFRGAAKERTEAALVLQGILNSRRKQIVDLVTESRLPAIYYAPEWVKDGGLMSYSVDFVDLVRRSATYVDKILKGAKPADLPVQQPKKFEFIVNLRAANQIGLTVPPNVLARADRVIK
jgi:ABC-type uncharacterized transport system substrate-binding protein